MHPDDRLLLRRFRAELDRVFRRQLVGLLVGGGVAVALVWVAQGTGVIGPRDVLIGGLAGVVGPLLGARLATR
jgi:hypothetical protein